MTNYYNNIKDTFLKTCFRFYILLFLIMPAIVSASSISRDIVNSPDEAECVAKFSYFPQESVDKPNGFQFINLSVGNIVSVEWDFGDGGFSDQFNPGHEFPGAGTYTVCLTVYCADSLGIICCSDSVCESIVVDYNIGGHVFAGEYPIPEGEYFVKASATENSSYYNNFFPVYYGDHLLWNDAERINVNNNNWELDIHLEPVNALSTGDGSIQGEAINFKTGEPLVDIEILLTDLAYDPISYIYTNQNGILHFSNLEYGTYYLTVEITGYNCNSLMVTIDEENTHIIGLEFLVRQVTHVGLFNKIDPLNTQISMLVYPNPASKTANIQFQIRNSEFTSDKFTILIGDVNGRIVHKQQLISLDDELKLNINGLPNGVYSVVLQNNNHILAKNKIVIIH